MESPCDPSQSYHKVTRHETLFVKKYKLPDSSYGRLRRRWSHNGLS